MKVTKVFFKQPISERSRSRAERLKFYKREASLWACLM